MSFKILYFPSTTRLDESTDDSSIEEDNFISDSELISHCIEWGPGFYPEGEYVLSENGTFIGSVCVSIDDFSDTAVIKWLYVEQSRQSNSSFFNKNSLNSVDKNSGIRKIKAGSVLFNIALQVAAKSVKELIINPKNTSLKFYQKVLKKFGIPFKLKDENITISSQDIAKVFSRIVASSESSLKRASLSNSTGYHFRPY